MIIFDALDELAPRLYTFQAKMYAFLVSPRLKPSWRRQNTLGQKQYLVGEVGENLTNKFIWIEWVTEWVPFHCLPSSWMLRHPWTKSSILPYKGDESLFCRKLLSFKVVVRTVWNFGGVLGYHPKYFILKTPSGHLNVCKYLSGRRFHRWFIMNKNKPLAVYAST